MEYREIATGRWITRCSNPNLPFEWTLNPYRGCEFGCKYCYARYAHEFMELREPEDFERLIFAKAFDARRFAAEIRHLPVGASIAIGTATDPYQPAERRYQLTRRMMQAIASTEGRRFHITTKSDLYPRDLDVLAGAARTNALGIHATVTTMDAELARQLEPLAPRPDLRLAALGAAAGAGLWTSVMASPVLPGLNDSQESLDRVAQAAREAGARWFGAHAVFLRPCASQVMIPFLKAAYPALAPHYERHFSRSTSPGQEFVARVRERVGRARERAGFPEREAMPEAPEGRQMRLPG